MFVPSAKSNLSLFILLVVSIALFIWVDSSREFRKQKNYDQKIKAAQLMQTAEETIKEYQVSRGFFIDLVNDPNQTTLIGEKNTIITTDRGNLNAKLTSLNPNMAAVAIDYLKKAKLKKGDDILISCTASYPAVNLAVLSAAQTLGLKVTMISSIGASMFGMTNPEFTWLDLETLLLEKKVFSFKSVAASIGGGRDLGRGLNKNGREIIMQAVERNGIELVHENSLEENILKKMEIFEENSKNPKLYVNIGGGLSSLGNSINGKLIKLGLNKFISIKNTPLKGTMFLFADKKIPILHLMKINEIAEIYDLPIAPVPLPEIGSGKVFLKEHYNITVTVIAMIILSILILLVMFFDHHQMKLRDDEVYKD
ncbi:MAG: poly-gamma-glutamate system protein [Candidatus Cloacimonetes bacterium]|nr:poly-gamma-glutamate system protein [Candidatus Cloacimonadota bacterium]